jgi:hypothetical protein
MPSHHGIWRENAMRLQQSKRRQLTLRLLLFAGGCLFLGGTAGLVLSFRPFLKPEIVKLQIFPTATPFQPGAPDAGVKHFVWIPMIAGGPAQHESEPTLETETPKKDELSDLFLLDENVVLRIASPPEVNNGRSIKIAFSVGDDCAYGTRRACVSRHWNGQVTLFTVHSGLGGEGESFRSAVEGTGLDMAFFSPGKIQRNLAGLSGVPVHLKVGSYQQDDLVLKAVVRIPPTMLADYFSHPFDQALEKAAGDSSDIQAALESGNPLIIFEICGWQIPGEEWAPEVSPTSASIYLGVIGIQ